MSGDNRKAIPSSVSFTIAPTTPLVSSTPSDTNHATLQIPSEKSRKLASNHTEGKNGYTSSEEDLDVLLDPGTLPDMIYNAQMSWWRSSVRRVLVRALKHESRILGQFQVCLCKAVKSNTI